MRSARDVFKRGRADDWTLERIAQLSARDIKQLRENARRLNEAAIVALCTEALGIAATRARKRAGSKSVPDPRKPSSLESD